jgi:hypothetical protein
MVVCLACIAWATGVTAQDQADQLLLKYFNKTEAGISFGVGSFKTDIYNGVQKKIKNDELVITLQTVNGIKIYNKLALGVSIGVEKWQNGLFWPLYGYLRYDLKPEGNSFFGGIYLGYGLGTRYSTTYYHEGKGAFAMSIGLGYKMKVGSKLKFFYEIFYKYQALESDYNVYTQLSDTSAVKVSSVDYKLPLNFAGFKIGITIP